MKSEELMQQVLRKFSTCLVGKLLKRVELFGDKENIQAIKKTCREIVYEEIRTLERVLSFYLFDEGKNECIFFGKSKEKKDE